MKNSLFPTGPLSATVGLVFFLGASSLSHAATYYVDKVKGDDANAGSELQPWRSISTANSALRAGDTVLIGTGTYNEVIRPAANGSSESQRVVYRAKAGATVTVTRTADLSSRRFVTIDGIDISASEYVNLNSARYVTLQNMKMSNPNPSLRAMNGLRMYNAQYCVIRNNRIVGTNDVYQDLINIRDNAHHNLIENNVLRSASHTLVKMSGLSRYDAGDPRYNIVRNNTLFNDYHHCISVTRGAHHNVFEGNTFEQCGIGKKSGPGIFDLGSSGEAWHAWQPHGIYRFNKVTKSGDRSPDGDFHSSFGAISRYDNKGLLKSKVVGNRIYHNTFHNNYNLVFKLGAVGAPYGDNKFKNNVFEANGIAPNTYGEAAIGYDKDRLDPAAMGDFWSGNLLEGTDEKVVMWYGTKYSAREAESRFGAVFGKNLQGDPLFVDPASNDFRLRDGSPAVDTGVFLTTTSAGGSGTVVAVRDAGYFIDGYGIAAGDTIRVGNETVTIQRIDYASNKITVNRSIAWASGAGVSFPYSGSMPDIGGVESKTAATPSTPTNLKVTAN